MSQGLSIVILVGIDTFRRLNFDPYYDSYMTRLLDYYITSLLAY